MTEKILLALDAAEKSYMYTKNHKLEEGSLRQPEHMIALNALYESFVHYGLAVSQIPEVMCELEEESYIYATLIEPHLKVVNDIEMIAKQYTLMYVQYIAQIAKGMQSKEAVEKLFA